MGTCVTWIEELSSNFSHTHLKASRVKHVLHQAILKVDEKGTEAAAATFVAVKVASGPPTTNLNRPFLVFIVDESTKSIHFIGKITNPTQKPNC
uniref:Serpin domain-containing protein n=1 Tax=Pygocentrus nattereri TaxID=42514 RepID=A0A3B4DA57_PYGNA